MSTDAAGRTWAGNYAYRAATLYRPGSVAELQEVVAAAPRVRALGSRHSFNDVADSDALVSLDALPDLVELDAHARTVRVGGGTRYGALAARLHAAGWALHNLASLPHIAVAGAVATATHGSGDRSGNLASAVRGLELVRSDGELVTLGPDDADLAGAVVGLGALGVVVALTLEVEPTYEVAQEVRTGLPWDAVLENLDEITGSADSVSLFTDWRGDAVGQVWRKTRVAAGAPRDVRHFGAPPAQREMHPLSGVDPRFTTAQRGVPGPWHERLPHFRMEFTPSNGDEIQSEYLVPREHAPDALRAVRAMADRVAPLLLVSEVRTVASDDLWLSTASGRESVALHFTWAPRQADVEALLPDLEAALAPFDARPHWGKVFADRDRDLARLYPRMADFRALTERMDPRGALRNDYLARHVLA
ncbi:MULTISPECIES: D-arabinono-1,4-lactone oxidase [unclassified Actinotalea]|uniref:D-arabinono-1,4-lactone oxidase n=1 Tax=unclassified Actinotalea TaxID=2638618 RepID=UPI0015F63E47|nr:MULTISPECIES: D-arabinono-1,4-lactone oxidase [unclassified Actinotalea]